MHNNGPSSNMLMTQAVLFWVVAWWLAELVDGDPIGNAVACVFAFLAMSLAVSGASHGVAQPSPLPGMAGRIIWALRPRKWMIAWGLIIAIVAVFGRPMVLDNYGGGRCRYVDWWLEVHWRPAQGDGAFDGCRFLAGW